MEAVKLYNDKKPLVLGEGPIYRYEDHTLHFNDFGSKQVHILPLDAKTGDVDRTRPHIVHDTKDHVSVQFFRKNKPGYICLYYQGVGVLDEATGDLQPLKVLNESRERFRMNDGMVDSKGRFWGGEFDAEAAKLGLGYQDAFAKEGREPGGRLWRLDLDGSAHAVLPGGLAISNGIGFSPDNTKMYVNDSLAQRTYVFDYDNESGNLSNQRVLRDFRGTKVEPDGLIMDVNGNIWTALYNGYAVECLDGKTGETLVHVDVPAQAVTCPTWGGENHDTLYVTTAAGPNPEFDGQLYRIKTNVQGQPDNLSAI